MSLLRLMLGCTIFSDLIHNNPVFTIVTIVRFVNFIACSNSLSISSTINKKTFVSLCQILWLAGAGWQQQLWSQLTAEHLMWSQLAAVTDFVIPADYSHRVRDPIWVGFDSQLTGITSPVTTVSWDHRVCYCSQLGSQMSWSQPAGCSHTLCDPSWL